MRALLLLILIAFSTPATAQGCRLYNQNYPEGGTALFFKYDKVSPKESCYDYRAAKTCQAGQWVGAPEHNYLDCERSWSASEKTPGQAQPQKKNFLLPKLAPTAGDYFLFAIFWAAVCAALYALLKNTGRPFLFGSIGSLIYIAVMGSAIDSIKPAHLFYMPESLSGENALAVNSRVAILLLGVALVMYIIVSTLVAFRITYQRSRSKPANITASVFIVFALFFAIVVSSSNEAVSVTGFDIFAIIIFYLIALISMWVVSLLAPQQKPAPSGSASVRRA